MLILTLAAPFHASADEADDEVTDNPDRPYQTDSTSTVPPWFVQLEMGMSLTKNGHTGDHLYAFSTPFSVRLGLTRNIEGRFGGGGLLYNTSDETTELGMGDLQVGARYRFFDDGAWFPSLGIEPTIKLPVASRSKGLGTGQPDFAMALLMSKDLPFKFHVDANGIGAYLGEEMHPGRFYFQQVASLVISYTITDRLGPFWEIVWASQSAPGEAKTLFTDFGYVYLLYPWMTIDLGLSAGLSKGADTSAVVGGFTMLFGQNKR